MINQSILDVPLHEVPKHHLQHILHYSNKKHTKSVKKDLQSEVRFLSENQDTEDRGKMWVETHAKNVNVRAIILTLRALEKVTGVKVHRVVKTSYLLNVFLSHNFNKLADFLNTFKCFPNIDRVRLEPSRESPFKEAKRYVDPCNGAKALCTRLRDEGISCSHVCYAVIKGQPYFVAITKGSSTGLSEFNYIKNVSKVEDSIIDILSVSYLLNGKSHKPLIEV